MREQDRFCTVVRSLAFGGDGVCQLDGLTVLVPGVVPGEKIVGEITRLKKDFARAKVLEIMEASPERVLPACPLNGRCPGCCYGHLSYAGECAAKQEQLLWFLRALEQAPEMKSFFMPPEHVWHNRNKIVLHVQKRGGAPQLGYVGSDNQTVFEVPRCLQAMEAINEKLAQLREEKNFWCSLHDRMKLTFRYTEKNGVLFWRNQPPKNLSWLKEQVFDQDFAVPAGSFFQVNNIGGTELLRLVETTVRETQSEFVVDAYCGAGVFALAAARAGARRVTGVELDAAAVQAAEYNFRQYQLPNARAIAGDASLLLPELLSEVPAHALLIVDPPRTGLDGKALGAIVQNKITKLIYISCNPSTLYRDARRLEVSGMRMKKAQLIDMFPRSGHFEVFTYFEKEK